MRSVRIPRSRRAILRRRRSRRPRRRCLPAGQALPAAITLTTSMLTPSGGLYQLTPYEGMRVSIPSLTSISGTDGNLTEKTEIETSNGQFYGGDQRHGASVPRAGDRYSRLAGGAATECCEVRRQPGAHPGGLDRSSADRRSICPRVRCLTASLVCWTSRTARTATTIRAVCCWITATAGRM